MAEIKVIDISQLKVQTCPYVDWFKFKRCTIKTCRNYTSATTSRCLAIDRVQPIGNKNISDAELHLFKFPNSGVSTRFISIKRKKAVQRVKALLILHAFIEYVRVNYKPDDRYWSNKLVERLELEYPLKIMKLGYMNWMLPYLTSQKVYLKFAAKRGGETEAFKPNMLLGLTELKFKALRKAIKTPTTVNVPPSKPPAVGASNVINTTKKEVQNHEPSAKSNVAKIGTSSSGGKTNYPRLAKSASKHHFGRAAKIG